MNREREEYCMLKTADTAHKTSRPISFRTIDRAVRCGCDQADRSCKSGKTALRTYSEYPKLDYLFGCFLQYHWQIAQVDPQAAFRKFVQRRSAMVADTLKEFE